MFKKLLFSILLLSTIHVQSQELKSVLLYVGPHHNAPGTIDDVDNESVYSFWETAHIDKFKGANSFIVNPTGVRPQYVSYQWNVENPWIGSTTPYYNYSRYVMDVVKTLQAINESSNNGAKVYISLPRYHAQGIYRYYGKSHIRAFFTDLKYAIDRYVSPSFWQNNVDGFYMFDENYDGCVVLGVSEYCGGIDTDGVFDKDFTYFRHAREAIDNLGSRKEFIWSPSGPVSTSSGSVHNSYKLSDLLKWQNENSYLIFDRILLQPGYSNGHCTLSPSVKCLELVFNRVNTQTVNGVPAGESSIGVNMEMLPSITKYSDYEREFSLLKNRSDFVFFGDARNSLMKHVDKINAFYE